MLLTETKTLKLFEKMARLDPKIVDTYDFVYTICIGLYILKKKGFALIF